MKLKVGDRVRIRTTDSSIHEKTQLLSSIHTIFSVEGGGGRDSYIYTLKNVPYYFCDDELELVESIFESIKNDYNL